MNANGHPLILTRMLDQYLDEPLHMLCQQYIVGIAARIQVRRGQQRFPVIADYIGRYKVLFANHHSILGNPLARRGHNGYLNATLHCILDLSPQLLLYLLHYFTF